MKVEISSSSRGIPLVGKISFITVYSQPGIWMLSTNGIDVQESAFPFVNFSLIPKHQFPPLPAIWT